MVKSYPEILRHTSCGSDSRYLYGFQICHWEEIFCRNYQNCRMIHKWPRGFWNYRVDNIHRRASHERHIAFRVIFGKLDYNASQILGRNDDYNLTGAISHFIDHFFIQIFSDRRRVLAALNKNTISRHGYGAATSTRDLVKGASTGLTRILPYQIQGTLWK